MTVIAFVGSVFSPYYRRALARNPTTDAQDHCAINVCLYGPRSRHWAMTERGRRHVHRDATSFAVGPSHMRWDGQSLVVDLDESCAPLPRRLRGRLVLHPGGLSTFSTALDPCGRHRWGPIAPCSRIDVDLPQPGLRWQGSAYFDSNEGDEPIERGFVRWDWLRAPLNDGRCAVVYDVHAHNAERRVIGARFASNGSVEPFALEQRQRLPATRWWRVDRRVPGDGETARVQQTLEDTPFYARSLLHMQLGGEPAHAMHETLDVARLVSPVVQRLLQVRMPRVA